MMNSPIFRPIQRLVFGAIAFILAGLALTTWLTHREQRMLAEIRESVSRAMAFEQALHAAQASLVDAAEGEMNPAEIVTWVRLLRERCPPGYAGAHSMIDRLELTVHGPDMPTTWLRDANALLREIDRVESEAEIEMMRSLEERTQAQRRYELAAPALLILAGIVLIPIVHRRVMRPLEDFGRDMTGLAEGRFDSLSLSETTVHTLPLHRNLMKLATKLEQFEREHREREATLESEVRAATRALLEQQRSLASAERLAVTGEMAAQVAHELRNPLAGIQMSLLNLSKELTDAAMVDRLELAIREVERVARLVDQLVSEARHQPEPASSVELHGLVEELFSLTRYQLAETISLHNEIPEGLRCRLPEQRLRQALLNLVLNSAAAIDARTGNIRIGAERGDDGLRIIVRDDGPGFPASILEGGARPFLSARRAGGTGLGLAMVRRFVGELSGRLELANEGAEGSVTKGARVTLLLPSVVDDE